MHSLRLWRETGNSPGSARIPNHPADLTDQSTRWLRQTSPRRRNGAMTAEPATVADDLGDVSAESQRPAAD
ncbi:MAG: hypothetical protein J4F38_05780, partial [Pseudomonadales bacterium]|nr:hypothetical protein [Pseudomonadales bacterium]